MEGGIQEGCPVPPYMDDSNFAEESIQNITTSFVYAISIGKDKIEEGVSEEDAIASYVRGIEIDLQRYVFDNYVDCKSLNPRESAEWEVRKLLDFDRPIGSSSVPVDEAATDFVCSDTKRSEICVAINGRFTMLYTDVAKISQEREEAKVLTALMNAIDSGEFESSNPDVSMGFYGKRGNPSWSNNGVVIIPRIIEDGTGNETITNLSPTGIVAISASILVVAFALFASNKRRRDATFQLNNAGALTSLREARDSVDDYDLFEIQREEGDNIEVVPTSATVQSKSREMRKSRTPFPVILPVVQNSEGATNDCVEIQYHAHDVNHYSSTADERFDQFAERDNFTNSSGWHTGSEIDFSDNVDRDDNSVRSYSAPNTVNL